MTLSAVGTGGLRPQGGGAARQIQLNQFKVLTAKSTVQTNRKAGVGYPIGLKGKANTPDLHTYFWPTVIRQIVAAYIDTPHPHTHSHSHSRLPLTNKWPRFSVLPPIVLCPSIPYTLFSCSFRCLAFLALCLPTCICVYSAVNIGKLWKLIWKLLLFTASLPPKCVRAVAGSSWVSSAAIVGFRFNYLSQLEP